jgi:hypothetical protein
MEREILSHRPVQYLDNVLEQITGPSNAGSAPASISVRFGALGAQLPGYEAIHMIRKESAVSISEFRLSVVPSLNRRFQTCFDGFRRQRELCFMI